LCNDGVDSTLFFSKVNIGINNTLFFNCCGGVTGGVSIYNFSTVWLSNVFFVSNEGSNSSDLFSDSFDNNNLSGEIYTDNTNLSCVNAGKNLTIFALPYDEIIEVYSNFSNGVFIIIFFLFLLLFYFSIFFLNGVFGVFSICYVDL
jgi:hypothetical protein